MFLLELCPVAIFSERSQCQRVGTLLLMKPASLLIPQTSHRSISNSSYTSLCVSFRVRFDWYTDNTYNKSHSPRKSQGFLQHIFFLSWLRVIASQMPICSCVLCIRYNTEVMLITGVSVKSHTHSSFSIVLPSLSNFCRLTLATTANDHSYIPIQFRFLFFFKIYALLHNTIVRSMMLFSLENPMTYGIGLRRS
jgi:hypothetical protein